ncbi:hypothetical protein DK45_2 [Bordetella bronchiseptica]|nr:hypothetical protein DK45_2 [Bordetella bronchiseptica]
MGVDQRAARIAGIDRRVGLDEILIGIDTQAIAPQRRHDALRSGLAHAEGVADGQHHVAHPRRALVGEGRDRQLAQLACQLEHRQVGLRIRAHHLGRRLAPVGQGHLDGVGGFDDVIVGQHIALGADDHPRAQAGGRLAAAQAGHLAEQLAQHGIVGQRHQRHVDMLGGVYVDHRRRGARHRVGIRRPCLAGRGRRGRARGRRRTRQPQPIGAQGGDDE